MKMPCEIHIGARKILSSTISTYYRSGVVVEMAASWYCRQTRDSRVLCQNEKMPGDEKPAASFENGLQELEKIVKEMEGADLPLERALELFEKGMRLSEACRKQLEEAETRIEVLVRKGNKIQAEPFQPDKV
jgi:exodeoxyribonuclease VII small subunit